MFTPVENALAIGTLLWPARLRAIRSHSITVRTIWKGDGIKILPFLVEGTVLTTGAQNVDSEGGLVELTKVRREAAKRTKSQKRALVVGDVRVNET